jgi:cell division protein FtsB
MTELLDSIEDLQAENALLKAENETLRAQVAALGPTLTSQSQTIQAGRLWGRRLLGELTGKLGDLQAAYALTKADPERVDEFEYALDMIAARARAELAYHDAGGGPPETPG